MPRFWLTEERTQTIRTLVEAPSAQAVHQFYLQKDTDWTSTDVHQTQDHVIISAENNQRAAGLTPDVQVAVDGTELDDDDPAYKEYVQGFPKSDPRD